LADTLPPLRLRLKHRIGTVSVDVAFTLTQPWTVLFGPSGSGKTTILRSIAGLVSPLDARIELYSPRDGHLQVAVDTATRIFVPPHRRWVRWSAQSPALFPHRTVRQNLRMATGEPRPQADRTVDGVLDRFRLGALADRRPHTLSGGERQRVAVARAATAANGRLLLLDEPFTGLDLSLRDSLLEDLQAWLTLSKTPVLSVTHDVGEAFELGAEIIKIAEGEIVAQGPVQIVLAEERDRLKKVLHS